jgi:hypothetical protein
VDLLDGARELVGVIDDDAGSVGYDDLGEGAAALHDDRGTAGHHLDQEQAERFSLVDREDSGRHRPGLITFAVATRPTRRPLNLSKHALETFQDVLGKVEVGPRLLRGCRMS